jgi:hypothetical protein
VRERRATIREAERMGASYESSGLRRQVEESGGNEQLADQCRTNSGKRSVVSRDVTTYSDAPAPRAHFTKSGSHTAEENIGAQTGILAQNSASIRTAPTISQSSASMLETKSSIAGLPSASSTRGVGHGVAFCGIRLGGFCQATDHTATHVAEFELAVAQG